MPIKDYYKLNRELRLEQVRQRYLAKREEIRAYKKQYQHKNKQRLAAEKAAKYLENKEAIRARQAEAYAANPESKKQRSQKYRELNREYYRAYSERYGKQYRANNPEKLRAKARRLYHADPGKFREYQSRRKALKLNAKTERINFKKILHAADGVCGICKQPFDLFGIDFDHIVPLSRGGTHTTNNMQATHSRCNRSKGAKTPEEMASCR